METTPNAIPDEGNVDQARPEYARVLDERFELLERVEREVLTRRLLTDTPETLEAIASDHFVTGERIRQIAAQALERLHGHVKPEGLKPRREMTSSRRAALEVREAENRVIDSAIERLRSLHLPVTEAGLVEGGFEVLDARSTRLLLKLTRDRDASYEKRLVPTYAIGRRWLVGGGRTPEVLFRELLGPAAVTGVIDDFVATWSTLEVDLRPHCGSDEEAAELAAAVIEELNPVEVGDNYVISAGTGIGQKLERILRAAGSPMSKAGLMGYFDPAKERQVANALARRDTFCVVERGKYGLVEFGMTPLPRLRDLIYEEIDKHGQVAISYLQGLAEELGYSPTSVLLYAALPDLVEQGGALRHRRPEDRSPHPDPAFDHECVRVARGPNTGRWSVLLSVNHGRLYTGSQRFPRALAGVVGLEFGSRKVPVVVNGVSVRATYLAHYPYLLGGELRPLFDKLGYADGQRVRIVASNAMAMEIVPVPDASGLESPFRALVDGAGLYDESGSAVPQAEVVDAMAYAVGFDAPVPVQAFAQRLRDRHNGAWLEALELIHPELAR